MPRFMVLCVHTVPNSEFNNLKPEDDETLCGVGAVICVDADTGQHAVDQMIARFDTRPGHECPIRKINRTPEPYLENEQCNNSHAWTAKRAREFEQPGSWSD